MKKSAGLIMYRYRDLALQVLLVHPGGPFWANKDKGAWSIPKGEYGDDEDPLAVAKREFKEETGQTAKGDLIPLSPIKQPGGKFITAWAFMGNCDATSIKSNTFTMEWPPRSGQKTEFPEVDRGGWFMIDTARKKIVKGQVGFIDELCNLLKNHSSRQMG
jgi:predicted NUDIX family NTP pyrophosphohydrolase